jgi:hypothetical protein
LDYDPVLLSPKSILPRFGFLTGPGGSGVTCPMPRLKGST